MQKVNSQSLREEGLLTLPPKTIRNYPAAKLETNNLVKSRLQDCFKGYSQKD